MCLHVASFMIPLICYATKPCSEKPGFGEVYVQDMCYHVAACVIHLY